MSNFDFLPALSRFPGKAGVYIGVPGQPPLCRYHAARPFPAASLIKLPILAAFFRQVEAGALDLAQIVTIPGAQVVGGSGVIQFMPEPHLFSLAALAALMITVSDNTAANALIDRLGMDYVNATCRWLGMRQTVLARRMMDLAQIARGVDNLTTPDDMATFFRTLLTNSKFTPHSSDAMFKILGGQQLNSKLPPILPEALQICHKTGELPGAEHDAGVLFGNGQALIVVILTAGLIDNQDGVHLCRQVWQEAVARNPRLLPNSIIRVI